MNLCSFENCFALYERGRKAKNPGRRGMCPEHYQKWLALNARYGTPPPVDLRSYGSVRPVPDLLFWQKVSGGGHQECWTWTASLDRDGYGKFLTRGRFYTAHKYAYQALVTEVPPGLELDHLCHVRHCVNPWHLEPVTREVNNDRRRSPGGWSSLSADVCRNGHIRDQANTYVSPSGDRTCRPCNRAAQRRMQARKASAAAS